MQEKDVVGQARGHQKDLGSYRVPKSVRSGAVSSGGVPFARRPSAHVHGQSPLDRFAPQEHGAFCFCRSASWMPVKSLCLRCSLNPLLSNVFLHQTEERFDERIFRSAQQAGSSSYRGNDSASQYTMSSLIHSASCRQCRRFLAIVGTCSTGHLSGFSSHGSVKVEPDDQRDGGVDDSAAAMATLGADLLRYIQGPPPWRFSARHAAVLPTCTQSAALCRQVSNMKSRGEKVNGALCVPRAAA